MLQFRRASVSSPAMIWEEMIAEPTLLSRSVQKWDTWKLPMHSHHKTDSIHFSILCRLFLKYPYLITFYYSRCSVCTDKQLPVLPVFRENSVVDVSSCASVHHVSSERNENRQKTVVRAAKPQCIFKTLTIGYTS